MGMWEAMAIAPSEFASPPVENLAFGPVLEELIPQVSEDLGLNQSGRRTWKVSLPQAPLFSEYPLQCGSEIQGSVRILHNLSHYPCIACSMAVGGRTT
jgi:hypothetical protein